MDFGLAKPIRKEDSITLSDAIVGTPQYMSPEQARGDTVDRRTDVFSLGAVLYHVLTNRPPFDGHSPGEIMMSVLADDPAPMRKLNPRIHEDVETICLKALDKDRQPALRHGEGVCGRPEPPPRRGADHGADRCPRASGPGRRCAGGRFRWR